MELFLDGEPTEIDSSDSLRSGEPVKSFLIGTIESMSGLSSSWEPIEIDLLLLLTGDIALSPSLITLEFELAPPV